MISERVKLALDETRMLALGAQILVGFEFRGVFEAQFERLPAWSRWSDGLAILLMVVTLTLLFLPGPYHRLVEDGNDSARFQQLINRVTGLALAPFAISLGIVLAIVGERMVGPVAGSVAGLAFAGLALLAWYGLGAWHKPSIGREERAMAKRRTDRVERTPLDQKINQMLTEARVILPGAQALFGFQLAIVLTDGFDQLAMPVKLVHGAALCFIALSVILLIAPAAYHRIVYAGEDATAFHRTGSRLVTAATVPLAIGLACDVYVVGTKIVASEQVAMIAAAAVLALLVGCWHVLPVMARYRRQAAGRRHPARA